MGKLGFHLDEAEDVETTLFISVSLSCLLNSWSLACALFLMFFSNHEAIGLVGLLIAINLFSSHKIQYVICVFTSSVI